MSGKGDARFVRTFNLICALGNNPQCLSMFLGQQTRCLLDSVNYSNELVRTEASSFGSNLKIHRSSSIVIRSIVTLGERTNRFVDQKIRPRIEASRISSVFEKFSPLLPIAFARDMANVHRTPLFEKTRIGEEGHVSILSSAISFERGGDEGLTRCFET